MKKDTIVAISTALGKSAINIVRMSGDDVFQIANSIFKGKDLHEASSHTIHYGKIYDEDILIDEVLVSVFKAPKTFTREDMVEINCHGGAFVTQKILELIVAKGARMAEKGEFTERAFLNGRIDLTQAESVMDIVEARSEYGLRLAGKGLQGEVRDLIVSLREQLMEIIAHIEVHIDYPEYDDIEELTGEVLIPKTQNLLENVNTILKRASTGKVLREGIKTAIIGRPNVGKSSVLNALLKEEKAIVTEIRGTTRDIVEGQINIGGIVLNLFDTAGIRDSDDLIERIGIDKTKKIVEEAELILYVLNNNEPIRKDDERLLEMTAHKNRVVIIKKIDLESKINRDFEDGVQISALKKTNIDALEKRIKDMFLQEEIDLSGQTYLANARHIAKMRQAKSMLDDALKAARDQMPVDVIEVDLKNAWETLGEIIGESGDSELIDTLFSRFCLGK